jgi:predicted nucleotidyltransferase
MMPDSFRPTSYNDVNVVLYDFLQNIRAIAGEDFHGMYLSGSLALGDFDQQSSDIDFVVVTDAPLSDQRVAELKTMHSRFASGDSPWAENIEAVYITPEALRHTPPSAERYPQVEKDRGFFVDTLEESWIVPCFILREHGVVVAGREDLRRLINPVDPAALRRSAAAVAEMWLDDREHDPTWLDWLREGHSQSFVVLTLCRLLYTLDTGLVASKPAAARWVQETQERRWVGLIERALKTRHTSEPPSESDIDETLAMIEYTVRRFHEWDRRS